MTLCGSILAVLQSQWSLTDTESADNVWFSPKDWFDYEYASKPQVSVSLLTEAPVRFFGGGSVLTQHSYPRFSVNVWVPIPRGTPGTVEAQVAEDMRYEVSRIITANKNSIASFNPIVPLDNGKPRHEADKEPRILRYEISLVGSHEKITA